MGDDEKQSKIKPSDVKEFVNTSVESSDLDYNGSGNATSVDKLRERVRELEALVGGKEEALQVALQGLDSAMGVEVEYRAQLEGCRARVGEFQQAVQHRDQLIEQLSASLEHTLRARDELAQDGERLAQEVSLLRSQLQATSELVTQGSSKSQHDFMLLQHKNLALEDAVKKKDLRIEEMQRLLMEQDGMKQELDLKKGELTRYKTEAASHVQQLMKEVERLHRECVSNKSLERQRAHQLLGLQQEHERGLAALRAELEEHFGQQLMQIQEKHRSQFLEQNVVKHQMSAELTGASSVFSSFSSLDNSTAQQQLQQLSERAQQVASEREDLLSQLELYKQQVQSLSEKLLKNSGDDSQLSLRDDVAKENKSLQEKLGSLNAQLRSVGEERHQELEMYREAQAAEVTTWKKRVNALTLELQKVSEVAESYLLRLEECTKVHEAELSSLREAHAQELKFLGGQVEGAQQLRAQVDKFHSSLQEKAAMEKRLQTELQASIRTEEDLKGHLMEVQEELQILREAFNQQKDVLHRQSNDLEKLSAELLDKERSELVLKEELAMLKNEINSAKETASDKMYKEQIDKLNELLQQKLKLEEVLKGQMCEKEKVEQMLRKEIDEQSKKYEAQLNALNVQMQEKAKIEEQLRTELHEKEQAAELLRSELKSVASALENLRAATSEAEVYKKQVDSLNRQLQERSQSENQIISNYETRVKSLTFDLSTIESRLSTEIQDIQSRAREELQIKQETEKRLEGELNVVRSELLALKSSADVQDYKEQINKLNLLVQEKQKTESTLKAELEAVSAEVKALKENQQHLENLNSDLEERLRTEQRLQEELIAAAKMHKEQVDVLSAKISELTSQQNSLDNEAHSMRQEINTQRTYIRDLELIREQVSQSAKTKEVLINDLSVCVKSLTEDNASYQEKLESLNKRLDDECHRADENMMLREVYEKEISEHKQHIEGLERKLQEALQARDGHLKEISIHQQELKSYKEQLETLHITFTKEISLLQQKYASTVDESSSRTDLLEQELEATKTELMLYKRQTDELNQQVAEEKKTEAEFKTKVEVVHKEIENIRNQLVVMTEMKKKMEGEKILYSEQLQSMHIEHANLKENMSKEAETFSKSVKILEDDIAAKDELILKLNMELEEAACKFDDVNKLLLAAQQKFAQDNEANTKLWKTEESVVKVKEKVSEFHCVEIEENLASVSAAPSGLQESSVVQERVSRDRDSLNLSSISETELLQLESKLQHALNEKNEIEKSFKDHVNKLAESHQKEIAIYEEQLQAVHSKLEQLMKVHSNCTLEKNTWKGEMNKLTSDHEAKITAYEEKLNITAEKGKEFSEACEKYLSEKEALEKRVVELDRTLKEKDCVGDDINKLSAQFEKDISRYAEQLKIANETLDDLSRKYSDSLAENDSLKENITQMGKIREEISLYKEQLKNACDKFEGLTAIHMKCISEKDSFVKKISEKEVVFQEREVALQKKTEALAVCQKELVETREYMDLLKVNLQDEISKVRVELRNLVNICSPSSIETMKDVEVLKEGSSEELSFTNGKEDWRPDWSQKEGNGCLEQSFVCAATIHHDVSSLRGHVERLVSDLNSTKQKFSVTEELLAAKAENETVFKNHIEQLQGEMHRNEEEKQVIKDQLEELTVKFLTAQTLLAGKVEAENSLQKEESAMDVSACNRCKHLGEEISALNITLQEIEGKLKDAEQRRENTEKRCCQSEEERDKLLSEKVNLHKLIDDLKQKTENSQVADSKISSLEEMLKVSENAQNSVVLEYSSLKEDHRKLSAEKQRLEEVLEEMKSEVVRLQELRNNSLVEERQREASAVEKGTQEQLSCVKEEAAVCLQIRESNTGCSVEASLDLVDLCEFAAEQEEAVEADADKLPRPKRSLHSVTLKLIEQCGLLDSAKRTLTSECETLRLRLEEREAQEMLFNEELAAVKSRCAALEQRLQEARSKSAAHETALGAKLALECEVQALVGENSALKAEKLSLVQELSSLQEEVLRLRATLDKGLGQDCASQDVDCAAIKQKLNISEREKRTLEIQVEALTKAKQDMLKQFEVVLEEARHLRQQLEAAWQERAEAEEQLGQARCELAVAGLRRESRAVGALSPGPTDGPVFHLHHEVHALVEEMAVELVSLRQSLQSERSRSEQLALEGDSSSSSQQLEVQQKLEVALKSNKELLQEKQILLEQLQKQGASSEGDLVTQLSVYREQHEGLAEVMGSAGPLQESLRQQKEELLVLLEEKREVEQQLAVETAERKSCKVKLQLLEQQLHEKDLLYQELLQQKGNLQLDLQQLEEKLREREQLLQMQRAQLLGELRAQDLRLRRWQLQQRASEVERKLDESLRESPSTGDVQVEAEASNAELQSHLRSVREEMHRAHAEAVSRLKQHLEVEFAVRERALKAGFTAEMASSRATHEEELAKLQHALLTAEKEIDKQRNAELARCLGNGGYSSEELTATKERYEEELQSICLGLDEGQAHLFAVLKHLFEEFARQLVAGTTSLLQSQNKKVVEREVAKLNSLHKQQMQQLQAKLQGDHVKALEALQELQKAPLEADFDTAAFAGPLHSVSAAVMTQLHSADSSQVAIVQLKHLLYSEYTFALREATKGWAAAWRAEVDAQLQALERALDEEAAALKRLRSSPEAPAAPGAAEASATHPVEDLLKDAEALTAKAEELLERKLQVAEQALRVIGERLDAAFSPVAKRAKLMAAAQQALKENPALDGEASGDQYRQLAQQLSAEHAAEAARLRELLAQLEARRTREMEELRQYFEQKVQELEKHYSEEITSQHSRRHSSSSCDSDSEFATDALLGSGDHALNRIPPLTHICDTCAADPGYKELEERWRGELAKRVEEGRAHLSAAKKELEARYEGELSTLRSSYEEKLSCLADELSSSQQATVQSAKRSAGKSLQTLWRREIRGARTRLLRAVSQIISNNPQSDIVEGTPNGRTEADFTVLEAENGQESLEDLQLELSSQLRQLEAACRQCLQMLQEKLQKEKDGVHSEGAEEEAVLQGAQSVRQVLSKVQLEEKVRAEVRAELEQELEQQVEKVAVLMKANAEQEQMMFIENQKQMMKDFLEQHRRDLEVLKKQHQAELAKVKSGAKSNDVTSLSEATQVDLQTVSRRHETSQTDQQPAPQKLDAAVSPSHCPRLNKQVQTDEPEALNVSTCSQQVQTSPCGVSPSPVEWSPDRLRAQPFEANSLSLLSELSSAEVVGGVGDEEGVGSVGGILSSVQTACAQFLESLLREWAKLQRRWEAGLQLEEREVKFLKEEYVSECCLKLKVILSTLENKIRRLQETSVKHQTSSKSSSGDQVCSNDCPPSEKLAEVIQERDRWRHVGLVLKKLVEELLTYLSECEDEVNQTLLSEQMDVREEEESRVSEAFTQAEEGPKEADTPHLTPRSRKARRVHFAPTSFDLKNLNEQMLLEFVQEDENLSAKLRAELDVCLEQLRTEAAALTESPFLGFVPSPSGGASTVEGDRLEALASSLSAAKQRIADLEAERRVGVRSEEVAEGFGEQLSSAQQGAALGLRLQSLSQLQDKARSILANGRPSSPQEAQQLRLLDEICREGDRLADEARREREDLRQQVESADKRLRDTRRFLEEQAAEREQERDEFQQELVRLQEQLKGREKDLADQQRLSREVEALEQQAKEALARHQQLETHREALQAELKAAVDKVWLLRDVVAELELQAEAKDARSSHLESRVQELQKALHEQEASRQQLSEELESLRAEGGLELSRQVAALQEQLHAHRLQAEQCRPAAIKQMRVQIRELEANVERRTQQLEALHTLSSNQSSPSEDVSVREMFQCDSPEDMRAAVASPSLVGSVGSSPRSPPPTPLPLRELARLQERLQRHARAEEAALKKTRDLEMQLKAARRAEEEVSAERDVLQERVSEQLLRIASLEALVDAGRWKGSCLGGQEEEDEEEQEQEQERLKEQQLLQQRAQDAEEEAARVAADLEGTRRELQQLKEVAAQAKASASAYAMQQEALVVQLKNAQQVEAATRERCQALEARMQELAGSYQPQTGGLIPIDVLVDTLLADKNAEIDSLRKRLAIKGGSDADRVSPRALPGAKPLSAPPSQIQETIVCECKDDGAASTVGGDADSLQKRVLLSAEQARGEELSVKLQAAQRRLQAAEEQLEEALAQAQEANVLRAQLQDAQRQLADAQRERDSAHGLEELAGQVERQLETSAQLDSSLREGLSLSLSLCSPDRQHVPPPDDGKLSSTVDVELPSTRSTVELVQSVPAQSTSAGEETQHLQIQLQELHQQLHEQLQQMQEAAQAHAQREHQLQTTILAEKERVSELQRAVRREQRRALDLQGQLASQAVKAALAGDETRLQQTSQEAEQEKGRVRSLEQQLQQERSIVRQLKTALLTERQRFQEAQKRDAHLLHVMRLRLGEVAASATDRKQQRVPLGQQAKAQETQLPTSNALQEQVELPPPATSPAPSVEAAPAAPAAPTAPAGSQFPPEALSELQRRLSGAQSEVRTLRRRLNREQEVAQQLRAELNLLRGHNDSLDAQLSELRTTLAAQQAENDQLSRQLRALEEAELRQKSRASTERSIAQERARQLETNVAQLEAEVAVERAVREEAEAEAERLRQMAEALRKDTDSATAVQAHGQTASPAPQPIVHQIKDANVQLEQQVKEHSKVALTLARLVEERTQLQQRASSLSEQLTQLQKSEAKALATVTRLSAEKASATEECIALRLELVRVKEQLCQKRSETAEAQQLENRVNHLFGRYLRAESYRKALAWQKKYLLVALGGYQQTEAYTLSQLAHLASAPQGAARQKSSRARTRFRSVALVIVVIQRMKFLVRRWHYGRLIGGNTVLNRSYSESLFSGISAQGLRRSGGNSALSMSSWSVPASASASVSVSLGAVPHSPPSHDHSSLVTRSEGHYMTSWRSTEGLVGGLANSLTPSRLTQFVERYDSLQHRLGLATPPTVSLAPSSASHRGED